VRVETSGFKSFKVIYSRGSRVRWYSIGPVGVFTLDAARLEAGEIMVAVLKGKDPAAERMAERSSGTFTDLHARYLEVAKKKNKSWKQADALVKKHLLPRWALFRLSIYRAPMSRR
jgi:hypothetical protein